MTILTEEQVTHRLANNFLGRYLLKFDPKIGTLINTGNFLGERVMLGRRTNGFTIWAKDDDLRIREMIRQKLVELFADAENVEIDEHGTGTVVAG